MGGCLNNFWPSGNTEDDTVVRVVNEPRTVPYSRILWVSRIRTVLTVYLTIQNKEITICHLKKARAAIPEDDPR